ncbi:2,4-dichlorophenol 6-monooxygenase [Streptacidiphilus pinicola]|uniref:2,4-dichlorophenol 6-monooxygenase n=1 Tax=Streptacidiphilus pinicola TaxID=2219663 RepID=A0A2X0KAX9_9ACTN|nr:FAD-dependent monooxygenase [Streptacidiphilus pinicola]RAG86335.1 2,4-dichlorophenol 6-monooxygenase [Streptacidiphilus pinicola]
MYDTDVLVVGSGPAGSSAALMLSTYGIDNIVITKHRWLANSPRAHYKNQRTMEVFRDLGVADEIRAKASPKEVMGNVVFCTSLVGEELGRLPYGANRPQRQSDYASASPAEHCDLPQNLLEPILLSNAAERGSHVRFDTEFLRFEQDEHGVTAHVLDRLKGEVYQIRAKYLIGADGGNSLVAEQLGLPMEGHMGLAGSISIILQADLSHLVAHRPGYLWWIMQPGANVGGIGMGLLRMVRPWNEWQIVWGYDMGAGEPDVSEIDAVGIARQLIGDASADITIRSVSTWTVNQMYATRFSQGRVFCMGDAVHRHPPSNGLGSNTSIQDAYNLTWKLAMVLKGQASDRLLETYDQERAPIGRQIVERANKSIEQFGGIFSALGLDADLDADQMLANMSVLKEASAAGATKRKMLREAIELKSYEFATQGVELNQRYESGAVCPDGTPEPAWLRDPELYYQASSRPGARLPHAWLDRQGRQVSSLDVVGKGRFALLTGLNGQAWLEAAEHVAQELGIEIAAHVIGPGHAVQDLYGDWADVSEVPEDGCLLVRPDAFVAWRAADSVAAVDSLRAVLLEILGLGLEEQVSAALPDMAMSE